MSITNTTTKAPPEQAIAKGCRVRIVGTNKTGVIARQKPDDEPFGNPPQRPVRKPLRFRVVNYDQRNDDGSLVDHGWFWWFELEPYERQPDDIPAHIRAAGEIGADILLAHRNGGAL